MRRNKEWLNAACVNIVINSGNSLIATIKETSLPNLRSAKCNKRFGSWEQRELIWRLELSVVIVTNVEGVCAARIKPCQEEATRVGIQDPSMQERTIR